MATSRREMLRMMEASGCDDDDEDGNDVMNWEEERRRRCQRQAEERAALRRAQHAAAAPVAGAPQISERLLRKMREEDRRRLAEATVADAWRWESSVERQRRLVEAEEAAEHFLHMLEEEERVMDTRRKMGMGSTAPDGDEEMWRDHEQQWDALERVIAETEAGGRTAVILASDIPFPPADDGKRILLSVAQRLLESTRASSDENGGARGARLEAIARKSFVKASLRWHPDKFMHRIAPLLKCGRCTDGRHNGDDEDGGTALRERLKDRFVNLSRCVNSAWDDMKEVSAC